MQLAFDQTSAWHGKLNLIYTQTDRATQIQTAFSQAPLKLQRPFYPEGKNICHSVILHTAGGIVGGDRLSQNIHLQAKTNALITTAAASKIYRSNSRAAKQTINIQIDTGACLEFLPQETIVFDGAIYRQDLRIELATEATWLGWEINRFGRSRRGEKFYTGEWRSHTEVWQQETPLWIDRAWLPGDAKLFHSPNALAGKPVIGTLTWLGKTVSPETIQQIRQLWQPQSDRNACAETGRSSWRGDLANQPLRNRADAGVTQLMSGILCRYRGDSTSEARNWFTKVWHLLRLTYLQRDAIVPRVWQI